MPHVWPSNVNDAPPNTAGDRAVASWLGEKKVLHLIKNYFMHLAFPSLIQVRMLCAVE